MLHEAPVPQVCTALFPEHCFIPGLHGPVHWALGALPVQLLLHATAVPQEPSFWHCCTPFPWHSVALGAQTPVQVPLEHAYGQVLGLPQLPVESHVWTALPEHWADPGVHTPVHAPETHAWLVQSIAPPQLPVESQIWTALFEHCVAPGVHLPVHVPMEHA